MYYGTPVLRYSGTPVLLYSYFGTPVLILWYSCTHVLLYSCTPVLLYSCTPVLLYSCTPVLLYFCITLYVQQTEHLNGENLRIGRVLCIKIFLYVYTECFVLLLMSTDNHRLIQEGKCSASIGLNY